MKKPPFLYYENRGFALISTIIVMSLLLVLAISLMSMSSIETRTNNTNNARFIAQANAKMSLAIALGELQAHLGPDARATANASILDTDPATSDIEGVANPHWLGAYPTINPSSPDDSILNPAALRTFSRENIDWLVSHPSPSAIDPTTSITGDSVTLAQFVKDSSVTIPAGSSIDSLDPSILTKAEAGLINIKNSNNSNSGRYAYWIADESMKARIDSLASVDGSDVLDGSIIDEETQRKNNYEIIQGTNFESLLPNYNESPDRVSTLITPNTLQLLSQGSDWQNWSLLNQDKFSNYSRSLPVDVVNGRLKKDLSAYIKGAHTELDNEAIIDPRFEITAELSPTFNLVKQWANLIEPNTDSQPVVIPNSNPQEQQVGLHPVITQGATALQHSYVTLESQANTASVQAVFMIMPQIQLWNPHNVALEAQDYIVQIGYTFDWWMQATGTRNTENFTWAEGSPQLRSWVELRGQSPLPVHEPADNERINYQENKRFFTFVIRNQAFEPGESLVFYAKPPESGPISGVPYNMNSDADTGILKNYSDDEDLNLLVNDGSLDEFFYFMPPTVGVTTNTSTIEKLAAGPLRMERNFRSRTALAGIGSDEEANDIHINLYHVEDGTPSLLHAIKKPQRNERFGTWQLPTFPFNLYQDGSILATETYFNGSSVWNKDALINLGSSMLPSNFDLFAGGGNVNTPPAAGQPHSSLNQWNIRSQESFSSSEEWTDVEASSWLNTFSFRDILRFGNTWQFTENLYENVSMDRLAGWWLPQVDGLAYPLFDYPTGEHGPLSLGSFQHANLSLYGWQPTYAFGNSQAPTRFDRSSYKSDSNEDLFDLSYVLNASTWDTYYLSSIPQTDITLTDGMRMPNSRMKLSLATTDSSNLRDDKGFDLSAAGIVIDGGFNVNSTSETAWKAFLSGALGQSIETPDGEESNDPENAAMGRFLSPLFAESNDVANDRSSTPFDQPEGWASTRTLNPEEIDALVSRIVQEVKLRGPFLSLSDFVNRRLEPDSDVTDDEKVYQEVLGTIQAAINKTSIEDNLINGHYFDDSNIALFTVDPSQDWNSDLNFNVTETATESMFGYPINEINDKGGLIHNYTPGFLSQADVLTKIGPSITVRGDTFTVRAYGDALDSNGEVSASAWCEAVVQRTTRPIDWDGSEETLIQTANPEETGFGREFKVISFRWLSKKDVQPFSDDSSIN